MVHAISNFCSQIELSMVQRIQTLYILFALAAVGSSLAFDWVTYTVKWGDRFVYDGYQCACDAGIGGAFGNYVDRSDGSIQEPSGANEIGERRDARHVDRLRGVWILALPAD